MNLLMKALRRCFSNQLSTVSTSKVSSDKTYHQDTNRRSQRKNTASCSIFSVLCTCKYLGANLYRVPGLSCIYWVQKCLLPLFFRKYSRSRLVCQIAISVFFLFSLIFPIIKQAAKSGGARSPRGTLPLISSAAMIRAASFFN